MGITVLGPLTVDGSGLLSRRDRAVLATLAARLGRPVSGDALADAVWGDHPPASAGKNLQGCIVRLRKLLGADTIATSTSGYTLEVPRDDVDAGRFESLVDRGRELATLGEADRAAFVLSEALQLWRGEPYVDLEEWQPARAEAHRLRELRLEAEELRADAQLRAGRHREVLAECQTLVRAAPLREQRWMLLARAQYQSGNQADALSTLHQLRSVLSLQLGIDPGPDVVALEEAVLRQEPGLRQADAAPDTGTCPWRGLRVYDLEDADWFHGREDVVAACLEILTRTPMLVLTGPSGSGKSSILRAGVAARLQSRGQRVVTITPGRRPTERLSALTHAGDAVLVVDQAEEAFTICDDEQERLEFLGCLVEEAGRRPVLVSIRGDHLADLAVDPDLSRLAERGLFLVGGLSDDGLRSAIEGPARQAGLVVEPGLVDLLVSEVDRDPGALPLLSHALLETWRRREGRTLTVSGYRASGGIHGAVAQSAERLYAATPAPDRERLRDLMLRLVSPGTTGEPVRTPVHRRQLAGHPAHEHLVEMLVSSRLVTSDDEVLEITHEALARAWPRLRGWLDDDVEGQRIMHHVAATADAWEALGRPASELYRGARLDQALEWEDEHASSLTPVERDFLAEGRAAAEDEARVTARRAREQARMIRRLRIVLTGAVGLLVAALAAGGFAVVQSDRAADNAEQAREAEVVALARSAAARVGDTDDIGTALLLGVAAVRLDESPETVSGLMAALSREPALVDLLPLGGAAPMTLAVHPDGRTAAVLDTLHHVRLLDVVTGEELAAAQVGNVGNEREEVRPMVFSPDGRYLAVAATPLTDEPVALLDAGTLQPLPGQPGGVRPGAWQVIDLRVSADGGSVAAAMLELDDQGDRVGLWTYVWDLDHPGRPVRIRASDRTEWATVALSPDGSRLYSGWPQVVVRDLATGRQRRLHHGTGTIDLNHDGSLLALAPFGASDVVVLDARTGEVRQRLRLPGESGSVSFSADGSRIVASTWHDRDTAVWDVRTGKPVIRLGLHEGSSGAVGLTPDGGSLLGASTGGVGRWDLDGAERYLPRTPISGLLRHTGGGACLATPSRGGQYVAYTVCGGDVTAATGIVFADVGAARASPADPVPGAAESAGSWNPTGREFATAIDGGLHVFTAARGEPRLTPPVTDLGATDVRFTPDGQRLVVSGSRTVGLLDADSREPVGKPVDLGGGTVWAVPGPDDHHAFVLVGGTDRSGFWTDLSSTWAVADLEAGQVVAEGDLDAGPVFSIAYSPTGRHAAVAMGSGLVRIIDLETGQPVSDPPNLHPGGSGWLAFSPDGSQLVSTDFDGGVVLWDVSTGAPVARTNIGVSVLTSAEFVGDGRILVAPWWQDGAVYHWDPDPDRALDFACRAAGRDLTQEEWARYFGSEPYREICPDA